MSSLPPPNFRDGSCLRPHEKVLLLKETLRKRIFAYCLSIPTALSGCGGCDDSDGGEDAAPAATQAWVAVSGGGAGKDFPMTIAMDSGSIYVAGWETVGGTDQRWRIEKRQWRDLEPEYVVTINQVLDADDSAYACFLHGGSLFVVGEARSALGDLIWKGEELDAATGSLATSRSIDPGLQDDYVTGGVADDLGLFLTGSDETPLGGKSYWRIERVLR